MSNKVGFTKIIFLGFFFLFLYFLLIPFWIVQEGRKKIYTDIKKVGNYEYGIVFGAGVKATGEPHIMLRDRLIAASNLYKEDKIDKILVSGDNQQKDYNEPQAMYNYLVEELDVPSEIIYKDPYGLRSYDSCIRAKHIYGIDRALLITQGYHLPRTIYLCEKLGVQSTGFSGTLEEYGNLDYFKLREVAAIYKSWYDINIRAPEYNMSD